MQKRKILTIAAACVALFGLIFAAVGGGVFAGLALPEIRDAAIAANADYPTQVAIVTRAVPTATHINNQRMYRVQFSWGDSLYGQSAPVYTQQQAESLVGTEILLRVSATNGRAVPVDFAPSARSTVGWVFLPVFGGIGLIALLAAGGLLVARGKIDDRWE